ncbi:hypothetical protein H310_07084 [Aphanomyces invadans]|uniref:Uncharacterized protein n=1 Tax=Aphanomyces invadans TaxID=157072 RepID=A0A024U4E6_9STRA|nr:hypothetical protein H310_07084 [Aphanomyces invadans]ETW00463.1 hypothetical protein H310_07084 [Aphanomyces invadans]|eukprot:XP_008870598.1 hypothetical protein H310_07084 [Aphanomyces invadans]
MKTLSISTTTVLTVVVSPASGTHAVGQSSRLLQSTGASLLSPWPCFMVASCTSADRPSSSLYVASASVNPPRLVEPICCWNVEIPYRRTDQLPRKVLLMSIHAFMLPIQKARSRLAMFETRPPPGRSATRALGTNTRTLRLVPDLSAEESECQLGGSCPRGSCHCAEKGEPADAFNTLNA